LKILNKIPFIHSKTLSGNFRFERDCKKGSGVWSGCRGQIIQILLKSIPFVRLPPSSHPPFQKLNVSGMIYGSSLLHTGL
jgi:hypothetical protein